MSAVYGEESAMPSPTATKTQYSLSTLMAPNLFISRSVTTRPIVIAAETAQKPHLTLLSGAASDSR